MSAPLGPTSIRRHPDRYIESELTHIKARIVAAWQEKVDPAGPPGSAGKGAGASLRKEGGELGRIGQIIGDLEWLCGYLHGLAGDAPMPKPEDGEKGARADDLMKAVAGEIVPRLDALAKRVVDIAAIAAAAANRRARACWDLAARL